MAITTSAVCNSFKTDLFAGTHNFTASSGNVFKLEMYIGTATIGKSTTDYLTAGETSGTNYDAGGKALARAGQLITLETNTACVDFANVSWQTATITARGALIYNNSASTKAVCVLDFGSDKTSTAGTFTINFPAPTSTQAIIRLA